jgi:hypothetical protein
VLFRHAADPLIGFDGHVSNPGDRKNKSALFYVFRGRMCGQLPHFIAL